MLIFEAMTLDEKMMQRCIDLARNGEGLVSPNPMVGAVVVHNGEIIGEGWHQKSGTPHAEVHAINSVKDKSLLPESTIYVSLEPCAHFGKTPPCANLIVQHKLKRVVVGTVDPNPAVAGKGIAIIEAAGIEVECNVLERECQKLNAHFFVSQLKKRPFITLKWARTANGFLDKKRQPGEKGQFKISAAEAQILVHKMRANHDAILVGSQTVLADNPNLDARKYDGNNPLKIILAGKSILPQNLTVFSTGEKTMVFARQHFEVPKPHELVVIKSSEFLIEVIEHCHKLGVQSIFVEGGATTHQYFLEKNLWDEIIEIVAPIEIEKGLPAPTFKGRCTGHFSWGKDQINRYLPL